MLDFSKSSDGLDHGLLITKLQRYGIGGKLLRWSGTSESTHLLCRVNGTHSNFRKAPCGVSRWSILGTLLSTLTSMKYRRFYS
ncbi:hypothetical protein AHF37_03848 [Paragonimus kellicotti]|nr:hypothetical protein AHF37_03848 [Paragonimus kellicotti]